MNDLTNCLGPKKNYNRKPGLFKIISLKENATPYDSKFLADAPSKLAQYCRENITNEVTNPLYNSQVENFYAILFNTRRRVEGHFMVSIGTLDTILVHAREVFRGAILNNAAAIAIMHNHPSGDPTPSESDVKITRELVRAGQVLRIEVLDHIILGNPNHTSLKELGYFYS